MDRFFMIELEARERHRDLERVARQAVVEWQALQSAPRRARCRWLTRRMGSWWRGARSPVPSLPRA